jgi:hypothetical protein
MTRKIWVSLASVLVAIAGAEPAYSFDYKIHPGSLCQEVGGDTPPGSNLFRKKTGYMYQLDGAHSYGVTCPIIRDRVPHFNRPDELTRIDACIHFNFLSGQETNLSCQWISVNEGAQVIATLDPKIDKPAPNILRMCWLIQPRDQNNNLQMAVDGTYSIDCKLPGLVFILRYVVGEEGSTDDNGGF